MGGRKINVDRRQIYPMLVPSKRLFDMWTVIDGEWHFAFTPAARFFFLLPPK
jgi:hypothetical protein